jgi:hypothetical protein
VSEPLDRRQSQEVIAELVRSVISEVLLAAEELPWCEHGRPDDGFGYWCSLRPEVLMCAFCFGAAQALAAPEEFPCSACGAPAPDKDRDVTVVAKPADGWASTSSCVRNAAQQTMASPSAGLALAWTGRRSPRSHAT